MPQGTTDQKPALASEIMGGAGFLLEPAGSRPIFTPQQFTEEQRMFYATAREFIEKEVLPVNERIEKMEPGLLPALLRKCGDLGLLSVDIPEKFGGLGMDKTTSALITEAISQQGSFAVAFGVQVGIGTMPIVIFGTEEQRAKYLPDLAAGKRISAYCLSESGAGSDAMAARTTARLDGDHYVLNGEKAWISNAGFADIFIIFAQVDGKRFSAFIVEKGTPGLSTGAEEDKMGLKGSSTRLVILEDVRVPKENLLGDVGRGHVIAFNILNIGRYKLGVAANGGAKASLKAALEYAAERRQFKTRIVDFPAIREKMARMAAIIWANEAMAWRLAGMLDGRIGALDKADPEHWKKAVEVIKDYAIECSILKVFGSEGLSFCNDEALQIHGGNGFTNEYPVSQSYRDSRVNKIFEGTNEINRMLIPGTLFKRVLQGKLDFMPLVGGVEAEVKADAAVQPPEDDSPLAAEKFMNEQAKKVVIYVAGAAAQKHMADLDRQQELLMAMADMLIDVWASDSALCRALQHIDTHGADASTGQIAVTQTVVGQCYARVATRARELAGYLANRPARMVAGIDRLAPYVPTNLIGARRVVAEKLVEAGRYCF